MAEYETKDSGQRARFSSGMVRDTDEGKPRFDLLFPKGVPYREQMLTRFADLMTRGAKKYTERNWEQANSSEELERAMASALRHMMQWYNGENDEDHAAGVMFNLMAAEYIKGRLDREDMLPQSCQSVCERGHDCMYDARHLNLHDCGDCPRWTERAVGTLRD
jgi:hypothetical protein